jgi:RNA polymerase sigma-70 factor, ECF subfamily
MSNETARLLAEIARGDRQSADALMAHIYDELREIAAREMRSERPGHTLQPTALVSEAFLRMVDQANTNWRDKSHFCAIAAHVMRRILVDHARKRSAGKRGGRRNKLLLSDELIVTDATDPMDIVAIDDVLTELGRMNERHARIVELRYFAGLTIEETAEALGVSPATVKNDWRVARAWLSSQLAMD